MLKRKELARKAVRLMVRKLPKKKETILKVGEFLNTLALLYRQDRLTRNFFLSPQVSRDAKVKALSELAKKYDVPKEVLEVLTYLIDVNAMSLIPEIKRLYDIELEKLMKMLKGELVLAVKLDKKTVDKIRNAIKKLLNRDIELDVSVDPSLIGGFIFKTQAFVVDTSIKTQLEKLARVGGV